MKRLLAWAFASAALLACVSAGATSSTCSDPNPVRYSLIPRNDLAKQIAEHRPLLAQLSRTLKRQVVIVQASSYGGVIEGLVSGTVDIASVGPASYAIAHNRDPSVTPFVTWTMKGGTYVRQGAHTYNSLLIALRDGGIRSIDDLKNRRIGLTDPASTSGAVLPRAEFARVIGRSLEDFAESVTYSGSHDRSVMALKKGYVDAAFVASEHLDEAIRHGTIAAGDLVVLWQSSPIPHDPFVYRGSLCPELKAKIRDAFMADTADMRTMLTNLNGESFVPVSDETYASLREILLHVSR